MTALKYSAAGTYTLHQNFPGGMLPSFCIFTLSMLTNPNQIKVCIVLKIPDYSPLW